MVNKQIRGSVSEDLPGIRWKELGKHRNLSPWVQVKAWRKFKGHDFRGQKVSGSSRRPFNKFGVAATRVLKGHSEYQVSQQQ